MQFQGLQGRMKVVQVWSEHKLMGGGWLGGMCVHSAVPGAQNLLFMCKSSPSKLSQP